MTDEVLLTLPVWAHSTPGLGPRLLKAFVEENGYSCRLMGINMYAYSVRGKSMQPDGIPATAMDGICRMRKLSSITKIAGACLITTSRKSRAFRQRSWGLQPTIPRWE